MKKETKNQDWIFENLYVPAPRFLRQMTERSQWRYLVSYREKNHHCPKGSRHEIVRQALDHRRSTIANLKKAALLLLLFSPIIITAFVMLWHL